jgi:hypothetical protein
MHTHERACFARTHKHLQIARLIEIALVEQFKIEIKRDVLLASPHLGANQSVQSVT